MSNFTISYVPQPDFSSCDEACLAMVAQIPIEEAKAGIKRRDGTGTSFLYKGLKKYKIDYMSWRSVDSVDNLPPLCILLVKFPTYGHSVLYYDGVFYDPEFGVMERYTPEGEISHYIELFIDEIYRDKQINIRIPADFMEAFEKDQEAYEIFKNLQYPEQSKFINGIVSKNPAKRKTAIQFRLEQIKHTKGPWKWC